MEVVSSAIRMIISAWRNENQNAEAMSRYCVYLSVSWNIVWWNSIFPFLFKRIDGTSF